MCGEEESIGFFFFFFLAVSRNEKIVNRDWFRSRFVLFCIGFLSNKQVKNEGERTCMQTQTDRVHRPTQISLCPGINLLD